MTETAGIIMIFDALSNTAYSMSLPRDPGARAELEGDVRTPFPPGALDTEHRPGTD